MNKVRLDPAKQKMLEALPVPIAVYQIDGHQISAVTLSQGFCELFGLKQGEAALKAADGSLACFVLSSDAERIRSAASRFLDGKEAFNAVYRAKQAGSGKDVLIHARGRIEAAEDGRLAYIWYTDEGEYAETGGKEQDSLNAAFRRILREGTLIRESRYDTLTGLPNMTYFFELADACCRKMREEGIQPAILFLDFCDMKAFNSKFGFAEGDRMISLFGTLLGEQFGRQRCSRFAQDHFAAITDAKNVEAELLVLFERCSHENGGNFPPIRAGIYHVTEADTEIGRACDRAKIACDVNRRSQVSCYQIFDDRMLEENELRQYIIDNLDRAIDEGWIKVYYQPIIRAADGKVCDEEALSRWIDPIRGFLSPADFIPALEESKLIYKLDLNVVDQVLEKMHRQAEAGMYVVPQSVNLSRMDFDSCDIVEEIRRRVDEAGIERSMVTIEITESVIGSDFDFMKEQVRRFRALGFEVWMDDFGSGYSSLDVLQDIKFDLIKFDMRFMHRFNEGEEGRIILTELTKMAIGLGVETVCEGVEQEDQVEFLREIGCTKIQGYYYGKPIPFDQILEKHANGVDMGFENPDEAGYYAAIGRINLYDISVLSNEDDESLRHYFNTLPMSIAEVNGSRIKYIRGNQSYRDFLKQYFGMEYKQFESSFREVPDDVSSSFLEAFLQCGRDGKRMLVDDRINGNTTVHCLVRRVAVNPLTGTAAIAIVVLAVIKDSENAGANYADVAKALSAGFVHLYYVNLDTDDFIEYSPDARQENLTVQRHGKTFFKSAAEDAPTQLYTDDQAYFIYSFTRENVLRTLDTNGIFTLTYRLMIDGEPVYVNMKAVRMQGDSSHIIIGVSNVDEQMRQKEQMSRLQAEQTAYARLNALAGGYLCFYLVDPETGHFEEHSATSNYAMLGLNREGDDFFGVSYAESERHVVPEDREKFRTMFTMEKVLDEIRKNGMFALQYRMMLDGKPIYVGTKAASIVEKGRQMLIIGVKNTDVQVRREQEYKEKFAPDKRNSDKEDKTSS